MKLRRLIILQIILVAGFGSVFLLPRQSHSQPMGVMMELPEFIGDWFGVPQQVTQPVGLRYGHNLVLVAGED